VQGGETEKRPADAADPDSRLVERAKAGDVRAFEALVRRYERWVFTLALRMVGDRGEAEDVAQDVFLKAYAGLSGFRGSSRFSTWLYAIASHHCLNHLAARARRPVPESTLGPPGSGADDPPGPIERAADGAPRPDELLERQETARQVQEALQALTEDHRLILVLREIQGLSYEEIAAAIGVEVGTVRSRLHRARMALKLGLRSLMADGSVP
jgi:RNA polymerase sigma-70 factor (ECF subfamily)